MRRGRLVHQTHARRTPCGRRLAGGWGRREGRYILPSRGGNGVTQAVYPREADNAKGRRQKQVANPALPWHTFFGLNQADTASEGFS